MFVVGSDHAAQTDISESEWIETLMDQFNLVGANSHPDGTREVNTGNAAMMFYSWPESAAPFLKDDGLNVAGLFTDPVRGERMTGPTSIERRLQPLAVPVLSQRGAREPRPGADVRATRPPLARRRLRGSPAVDFGAHLFSEEWTLRSGPLGGMLGPVLTDPERIRGRDTEARIDQIVLSRPPAVATGSPTKRTFPSKMRSS